ncbi:DUF4232 domain-containing protein [Streptomyces sp. TG1A-8]|uniref:DUF4232 domain-containing protein n=1 Tax=Streptomyces sp. TG1A-8 TaxID=3051385 RepID=UPI00265BD6D9|nr:DUF4232 domain-containing protein [Streptomyces sp. TG1A-8]MDO0926638.1 DUF4232 domain-containing protein [Streptomyces sp. TG1A-8]
MSVRTHRTRLLAAAALTAAALTLTACGDGEGVHDEGVPAGSAPTASAAPSPEAGGGTSTGTERVRPAGRTSDPAGGAAGSNGTKGSRLPSGSADTGSAGSAEPVSASTPCSGTSTRMTATEVSRPLNHLLLTVTNTGSRSCDLTGYPAVRFDEAQSVPPAFEDSKPQAVVTLAPGESGYAGVLLAAADGSGSHGYTARSLAVFFDGGAGVAHPSLPAKGVYVDDSIGVSYWQSTLSDALAW